MEDVVRTLHVDREKCVVNVGELVVKFSQIRFSLMVNEMLALCGGEIQALSNPVTGWMFQSGCSDEFAQENSDHEMRVNDQILAYWKVTDNNKFAVFVPDSASEGCLEKLHPIILKFSSVSNCFESPEFEALLEQFCAAFA
ncbi:MAG: hypothetical protein R3B38_01415 [Patescibacteria group bacterium]